MDSLNGDTSISNPNLKCPFKRAHEDTSTVHFQSTWNRPGSVPCGTRSPPEFGTVLGTTWACTFSRDGKEIANPSSRLYIDHMENLPRMSLESYRINAGRPGLSSPSTSPACLGRGTSKAETGEEQRGLVALLLLSIAMAARAAVVLSCAVLAAAVPTPRTLH